MNTKSNNKAMKATFNPNFKTKFNGSCRKEGKTYFESFNVLVPSKYGENNSNAVIELRMYGTGNRNYACLWVHDSSNSGISTSGTGWAGGYGYHRPSAAAEAAIINAGFTLSKSISGVGDSAIEEAIKTIAKALGYKKFLFFKAHQ